MASTSSRCLQRGACSHVTLRFASPCRLHQVSAAARRRHHHICNSARDPAYEPEQQGGPDMVSSMLNSCLAATSRMTEAAVSRLADALQSVAPPEAPRHKVEVSVKGALILLLLGLLKGVISFVLLVGCIGLAVYTATQVFGWNGVLLSQAEPHSSRASSYQHQQYPPPYPPGGSPGYQQGYAAQGPHYRQQQQQYGQQRQDRRPPGEQGDIVDVFHYPRPAAQ